MSQAIAASEVTLHLQSAPDPQFFSEWQQNTPPLSNLEQQSLDRVRLNFLDLLEDPTVLENSVKLVILAPLNHQWHGISLPQSQPYP